MIWNENIMIREKKNISLCITIFMTHKMKMWLGEFSLISMLLLLHNCIYIFPFRLRVHVIGHIIILLYSFSLTKVRIICTKIKCVYSNAMDMEPNIFSLRRNQIASIWKMLVKHATILLLCNSYCYIVVNLFGTKHSNEHVYGCFFLKRCFWLYWRTHTHTHTIRIYFCCGCICWQLFPLFYSFYYLLVEFLIVN